MPSLVPILTITGSDGAGVVGIQADIRTISGQDLAFCLFMSNYFFSYPKCVRDWSGILLERSGKRYSGKPDGDSRNAHINS